MKIAVITSGILPVPAVQGGAVENLIDYALDYNNKHNLHKIDIYSVYSPKVRQHEALMSSVNHYEYINTHSIRFRIGAKIYSLFGKHYCYHYQLEYFFEKVWKRMKRKQYDLIILENRPGFALQIRERSNTPIISHIHTNLLFEPSKKNKAIVLATNRFLAVSSYIKNEIKKVGVDCDIRVVYNGLNEIFFNKDKKNIVSRNSMGFDQNDFIAVYWGRLIPQKGILDLFQAMKILSNHKDIKLLVIGSINYEDTSQQTNPFIDELKQIAEFMHGRIRFTGYIPYNRIASYLSISDVAVIPSHINEAFGMTCIEACSMGLPVIATNDGGIPEALSGQRTIIIRKELEISKQIASAILKIKNNIASYQGNTLNRVFTKFAFAKSFFENIANP